MKIIQFLGTFDVCGAEAVVKDYCLELRARGHEVIAPIYYTTPDSPFQKMVVQAGVKVPVIRGTYVRKFSKRLYNKVLTYTGYNMRFIRNLLNKEKPDILHLHGYVLNDLKYLNHELDGIKLFYTCHNPPEVFFTGKYKHQYAIAKRLIDKHHMTIIALNQEMAISLKELFKTDDVIILNNPINVKKYLFDMDKRVNTRKKLNIPMNTFVVGNVGRFHKQKNHIFLLDVFSEICKERQNSLLIIVASSNEQEEKNIVEKKINSLGLNDKCLILYDRDDMSELYSSMDLFLFPSLFEGLSIAFLEAQIAGLRCVISQGVTCDGVITDNVSQLSLEAPIREWKKACLNSDYVKVKATQTIDDFDIKTVVDHLEEIYFECK